MSKVKKQPDKNKNDDTRGALSLALGILSILTFMIPIVGILLAIGALIAYKLQKKIVETRTSTAGLVTGLIGLALSVIVNALFIASLLLISGLSG